MFDDFLGLSERRFHHHRWVLFSGRSGSGKSTAIGYLLEEHPDFDAVDPYLIQPYLSGWKEAPSQAIWVVVDELQGMKDFVRVAKLMAGGKRVIMASHLPGFLNSLFRLFGRGSCFATDRDPLKLARYLEKKNIPYTMKALQRFVDRYGATYTDLEIIMERRKGSDFDKALDVFERTCSIR